MQSICKFPHYETHLGVTFSFHGTVRGDRLRVVFYILYVQAFKSPSKRTLPTSLNGERWLFPPSNPNIQPTFLPYVYSPSECNRTFFFLGGGEAIRTVFRTWIIKGKRVTATSVFIITCTYQRLHKHYWVISSHFAKFFVHFSPVKN
jgi:hypothetical protein